jgi:ribonuclease BN (tRNA processing enzyme)
MSKTIFSKVKVVLLFSICVVNSSCAETDTHTSINTCSDASIKIQVLGSGGPELTNNRASSSYLIWLNNKAVILMDTGGGSALRYGDSEAEWKDLKAVLFSHYHADHSSDLPALVKASWFGERVEDLSVFGPYGNDIMPSTKEFLSGLFDQKKGAYKYLSDFYQNKDEVADYRLQAIDINNDNKTQLIYSSGNIQIHAQKVKHGPIPAMAYLINICGKTIVYSGDTNGKGFENLILDHTDLFIAHNAIPENAGRIAKSLHMTPSQIGQIAKQINAKKIVLSHRMNRTLGKEKQTVEFIKKHYQGAIEFANDLDVF